MSLTFSRRSFLKYTAVAAVAVAGSSLLTGCKDDDNKATRTEYGKITVLQAQSTVSGATYDASKGELTFDFSVKCGRGNPMRVNNSCSMSVLPVPTIPGKKPPRNMLLISAI